MQSGPTSSNSAFRRSWVQTIFDFDQGNRTFDQLGDVRRNPPRLIARSMSDGGSIALATSQYLPRSAAPRLW
jgi:hypothetical protein